MFTCKSNIRLDNLWSCFHVYTCINKWAGNLTRIKAKLRTDEVYKPKTNLVNLLSVSDPSNFVSIEVNAEESVLRSQDHPVPVDEAG